MSNGGGAPASLSCHRPSPKTPHREARRLLSSGETLPEPREDLRTYGLGAQILLDLGVQRMRVMSMPKRLHGISGFGLEVVEYVS